jgi:hypothetical protein
MRMGLVRNVDASRRTDSGQVAETICMSLDQQDTLYNLHMTVCLVSFGVCAMMRRISFSNP